MATYIQGITDYIPQIQPFQPDYNFLGNVLQTKQSRYDAAHKHLGSVYGSLLNSPMTRDDNIERRDGFFKSINQDIQRMSGMDLSLQQNQDAAMQVFKGFYEDKGMFKDMMWTKNYHDQLNVAENFRNSVDPDKVGGSWWEGGVKALHYKAQEFKNVGADQALGFEDAGFTPSQNIIEKAMKDAKDKGFNVKMDTVSGNWIVTTKNGNQMVPHLQQYFESRFGNDPKVMDYFKTSAYVNRKDWVSQNKGAYGGDEAAANLEYLAHIVPKTAQEVDKGKQDADNSHDIAKGNSEKIDKHIKENGYIPAMDMLDQWADMKDEVSTTEQGKEVYKNAEAIMQSLNVNNIMTRLDQVDASVGLGLLRANLKIAASQYAALTAEMEIKENPFAKQAIEHQHDWQMLQYQKGTFDAAGNWIPGTDFKNAEALEKVKQEHEDKIKKAVENHLEKESTYTGMPAAPGTLTPSELDNLKAQENLDKQNSYPENKKQAEDLAQSINEDRIGLVKAMIGQAQSTYQKELMASPNKGGAEAIKKTKDFLSKLLGGKSLSDEQVKKMLTDGYSEGTDISKLLANPDKVATMYSTARDYGNPNTAIGAINQDWTKDIQSKVKEYDSKISENKNFYDGITDFNKEQAKKANDAFMVGLETKDETNGKQDADFWKFMYDGTNVNGTLANITTSAVAKRIDQWAESHPKVISRQQMIQQAKTPEEVDLIVNMPESLVKPAGRVVDRDSYMKKYKQQVVDWRKTYADQAASWTNPKQDKANAKRTMAFTSTVDAAAPNAQPVRDLKDFYNSYKAAEGESVVYFAENFNGNPEQLAKTGTNQSDAKLILDQFMSDTNEGSSIDKQGNPTKEHRARGDFQVTRIAGYSPNFVGFRVKPYASWAQQYTSGKDGRKLIDDDSYLTKGIVVYIPKDKVNNDFMRRTTYNMYDFQMATKGKVTVDNPMGAHVELVKEGDMYKLMTTTKHIDPATGKVSSNSNTTYHNQDLDLETFMNTFKTGVNWQAMQNETALQYAAKVNGVKDPNQLFNAPPVKQ